MSSVTYDKVIISDNANAHLGDVHNHYYGDSTEALAALEVAAAAIQFLDFATDMLRTTEDSSEPQYDVTVRTIEKTIEHLEISLPTLSPRFSAASGIPRNLEAALKEIVDSCKSLACKMIVALKSIASNEEKRHTKWDSIATALKAVWNKQKFVDVTKQLSAYREQITLRVLLVLNSRFSKVQSGQDEILEVAAIISNSLIRKSMGATGSHAGTLAAITTSRDGTSQTLMGPNSAKLFSAQPSLADSKQTLLRLNVDGTEPSASASGTSASIQSSSGGVPRVVRAILNALHFRSIRDRSSTVATAHQNTFRWAFESSPHLDRPWDNLSSWLASPTDCYWINGKAGSGKSTLMKYISQHPRLERDLSKWAGLSELVIASYYFWYAGDSLQKSQMGLIRSLLFDLINRRPEFAFLLFPDVCRHMLSHEADISVTLSEIELKKAFQLLPDNVPSGIKIFFLVDGIDEYIGDNTDLFNLFRSVSRSSSIKILLSSRPTPSCVRAFADFPGLRLQDLTRQDVRTFAEDELSKHRVMVKLDRAQPGSMAMLVDGITKKASGVFLWVALVVKRLYQGLDNYDTLSSLCTTLDELPEDLERLYEHMLISIDNTAFSEGARMMQAAATAVESGQNFPLTVLQLSYLEESPWEEQICGKIETIGDDEETWRCEITEGRMRSRCCGLLEVQEVFRTSYSLKVVAFLHRTVFDFLETSKISTRIAAALEGSTYDSESALLRSSLKELRVKLDPSTKHNDSYGYFCAFRTLSYLRAFNVDDNRGVEYITAIASAMDILWYDNALFPSSASQSMAVNPVVQRYSTSARVRVLDQVLLSAALQCPESQVSPVVSNLLDLKFQNQGHQASHDHWRGLATKLYMIYAGERLMPIRAMALRNINRLNPRPQDPLDMPDVLKLPIDPTWKRAISQDVFHGWSLWRFVLHHVLQSLEMDDRSVLRENQVAVAFFKMIVGMLLNGASTQITLSILPKKEARTRPVVRQFGATSVIMRMIEIWWGDLNARKPDFMTTRQSRMWKQDKMTAAELFVKIEDMLPWSQALASSVARRELDSCQPQVKPVSNHTKRDDPGVRRPGKKHGHSSLFSTVVHEDIPDESLRTSPWRQFVQQCSSIDTAAEEQTSAADPVDNVSAVGTNSARQVCYDTWKLTPPSKRIALLEPEEQLIASELSKSSQSSKKEQRALTNRLFKLPAPRRELILECSRSLPQHDSRSSS